jgi:glycosyltransferase involved in cell wall biosynthesis
MAHSPEQAASDGTATPPIVGTLSFVLVCKNNAATIERTIASITPLARELGGEVIALDNGSTDGTLEILARHGCRVEPTVWQGYIKTKQLALASSRSQWTFCIDSDESLEPWLIDEVRRAVMRPAPGVVGYRVNRRMWYAGAWLRHAWQPEWRLRLVSRGVARWGGVDPHDKLDVMRGMGQVADLNREAVLRHDSMESVADFLSRQVRHSRTSAEGLYAKGERSHPGRMVASAVGAFFKQLIIKSAWRDGWRGWVAAMCMGIAAGMKHAMLIEKASFNSSTHPRD